MILTKQGGIALQILIILVIIVLTSATMITLIKTGIITAKDNSNVDVLDTGFIPFVSEGTLAIKDFQFCSSIDSKYNCEVKQGAYENGERVDYYFVAESTVRDGNVLLISNYRVLSPSGRIILDAEEKDNFQFETQSTRSVEPVIFKSYFVLFEEEKGLYTLELILSNPLTERKVELKKQFELR